MCATPPLMESAPMKSIKVSGLVRHHNPTYAAIAFGAVGVLDIRSTICVGDILLILL
jgi:hypothetical protein